MIAVTHSKSSAQRGQDGIKLSTMFRCGFLIFAEVASDTGFDH